MLNYKNKYLDENHKHSEFDNFMKQSLLELKSFLKDNPDVFFSKSDKSNTTVLLYKHQYIEGVEKMISYNNTYQKIDEDPSKYLSCLILKFLDKLRIKKYLNPNIEKKDIQTSKCILARAYALAKIQNS